MQQPKIKSQDKYNEVFCFSLITLFLERRLKPMNLETRIPTKKASVRLPKTVYFKFVFFLKIYSHGVK